MLWLAVAFGIGIFAESILDLGSSVAATTALVVLVAAIFLRSHFAATFLIFISAFFAGTASAKVEKNNVGPDRIKALYDNGTIPTGDPVEVEGVLLGRPEASVKGYLLALSVERLQHRTINQKASGRVRLFLRSDQETDLKYGSRIRVATKLERDDGYLNPRSDSASRDSRPHEDRRERSDKKPAASRKDR